MLEAKIDPINPLPGGVVHINGIVFRHATISTKGTVDALSVISGPSSLQQAALDAVRHWTYRPYLLNNKPVEVETTINVVFQHR
jgi:protein TonB